MNKPNADMPLAEAVAEELFQAEANAAPIGQLSARLDNVNIDDAYTIQEHVIARREALGARRVGRKVGLTNPTVQQQLGVAEPDFGVLLDDMELSDGVTVDVSRLISPRIEAELAFIIGEDLREVSREAVIAAVTQVVASFEIVDSRISDWKITIFDTIADNASSARYVLGQSSLPLSQIVPADVSMTLTRNGEEISAGSGAACLGDPLNALLWVAETAAKLGRPLRAGEVVLSGALGPMVPFEAGNTYEAHISGLGSVTVSASSASKETE